jgi:ribosome maturation factor RimP
LDEVVAVVSEQLRPAGFDCIEAEWSAHDRILRLFVDQLDPEKGPINLDACVEASRLLLEFAPLDEVVPGKYTLEVSSPGVERPLRRLPHFERSVGSTVEVKLREKVQERRNGKGRLVRIDPPSPAAMADKSAGSEDDARITLDTAEGVWTFPLGALQRAHLVYDWGDA